MLRDILLLFAVIPTIRLVMVLMILNWYVAIRPQSRGNTSSSLSKLSDVNNTRMGNYVGIRSGVDLIIWIETVKLKISVWGLFYFSLGLLVLEKLSVDL